MTTTIAFARTVDTPVLQFGTVIAVHQRTCDVALASGVIVRRAKLTTGTINVLVNDRVFLVLDAAKDVWVCVSVVIM